MTMGVKTIDARYRNLAVIIQHRKTAHERNSTTTETYTSSNYIFQWIYRIDGLSDKYSDSPQLD